MKYISLTDGQDAIVDDLFHNYLIKFGPWYPRKSDTTTYAQRTISLHGLEIASISMHQLVIMKLNNIHYYPKLYRDGLTEIDHINHNGLDNRSENLRLVNHSTNMKNRSHSHKRDIIEPKDIVAWALDENNGELNVRDVIDNFYGCSIKTILNLLKSLDMRCFYHNNNIYRVYPSSGRRPRKLIMQDEM